MSTQTTDILTELRAKGWTVPAIADALGYSRRTVEAWVSEARHPSNGPSVQRDLERLLERRRIPKRKRYQPRVPVL